ncbi:hypothetical protein IWW47_003057, partial [Coemansia sp. RSA 2052]
ALMARERGAASELAVAFEGMQKVLAVLAEQAPGDVGATAGRLLDIVGGLVMDASHSLRAWALVHPTTLPDAESRALEATLVAAVAVDQAQREAVTEALAMLYATVSRKDRHLIVAAVARFAATLVGPAAADASSSPQEETPAEDALAPADVIADINELAMWRDLAQLAAIAGSLPRSSPVRVRALRTLREAVAAASAADQSPWALLLTRLAWLVNDRSATAESSRGASQLLSLVSDIAYRWYVRLGDCPAFAPLLSSSPALRLVLPVASELVWRMAPRLECALGDRDQAERHARDLLRTLAVYQPPVRMAADELAALLASVMQAVSAIAGSDDDEGAATAAAFVRCSEQLLDALPVLPVSSELAEAWHRELMLVAAPVASAVEPAANAVRRALSAHEGQLECAYAAAVEVGVCLLRISVPRRPVDPAAKARTQWTWLGDDVDVNRADLVAYRAIQRSMTGDPDTRATQPFAHRLADLERQHAAIELVYRPAEQRGDASFAELWQEAHNLGTAVLGRVSSVSKQIAAATAVESFAQAQAAATALLATLEMFETRVARRYFGSFRDVAQTWCAYTRQIRFALAQLVELRRVQVHGSVREHARLVAEIYAQPMHSLSSTESNGRLQSSLAQLKTLIFFSSKSDNNAGGGPSPLVAYGELLVALAARITLGVQARGALAPADLEALEIVFRDAYDIHKRAVDERKKRDAEAASTFKYRGVKEQTDDELLSEIFPGFEDVFDDKEEEEKAVEEPTFQDIAEDTVAALAACHQYVMLQFGVLGARPGDVHRALIAQAQRHAFCLAALLHRMRPDMAGLLDAGADAALRGANLLSLATVASATTTTAVVAAGGDFASGGGDISTSAGLGMESVYNFYKDAVPSEAVLLQPLAAAIALR